MAPKSCQKAGILTTNNKYDDDPRDRFGVYYPIAQAYSTISKTVIQKFGNKMANFEASAIGSCLDCFLAIFACVQLSVG